VLAVRDLVVRYRAATALDGVSLTAARGEKVAIIGPNGAGKTTLLNTLSGILRPAAGEVRIAGRLAHVPEGRQVFGTLTVEDNLLLGGWRSHRRNVGPVYELFPALRPLRRRRAATLSGGEQQMVAIGRALMADPELLAIDELSLGLAPLVVQELADHLCELSERRGMTLLLIEQNARLALDLCDRAYVLETGRITLEGPCRELRHDPAVRHAYLGGTLRA